MVCKFEIIIPVDLEYVTILQKIRDQDGRNTQLSSIKRMVAIRILFSVSAQVGKPLLETEN